mmetsp:Transcript_2327/g.6475  ORF Transcript_2327/g.6475 Transcript_2327/m.6475 type:complete len:83 (-) Transcript_2327:80-328(-)
MCAPQWVLGGGPPQPRAIVGAPLVRAATEAVFPVVLLAPSPPFLPPRSIAHHLGVEVEVVLFYFPLPLWTNQEGLIKMYVNS